MVLTLEKRQKLRNLFASESYLKGLRDGLNDQINAAKEALCELTRHQEYIAGQIEAVSAEIQETKKL